MVIADLVVAGFIVKIALSHNTGYAGPVWGVALAVAGLPAALITFLVWVGYRETKLKKQTQRPPEFQGSETNH